MLRSVPPPQPALPPAVRRRSPGVVAAATAVLAALAVRYAGTSRAGRADAGAEALVDVVAAGRRGPFRVATSIGEPLPVVLLAFALAGVCWWLDQRRLAVVAVLGTGLAGAATVVLKPVVGRTLDDAHAFPSGHTAAATALGLVTALLVVALRRSAGRPAAALLAAGALVAGGGMGLFLVAGEIHYATDTVGGFCAAVAAVLGSALAVDATARRRTGARAG